MTAVVSSSSAPSPLPSGQDATGSSTDLLPAPADTTALATPLAAIFECLAQQQTTGLALGEDGVQENRQEQAKALADQLAAIAREAANQSSSGGGFFGSIAKAVSDFVSDVASGNVGAAFGDAGKDLEAGWNSPHFWSDLQNGFEAISVVAAAVSQAAQDIGGPTAAAVAVVALDVDQGADIAADLAGAREQTFAAAAENAEADAVASKADLTRLGTDVAALLDQTKGSDQSLGQALDDVAGAILDGGRSLVSSVAVKG